jgi:hypothetical protein
VTGLSTSLARSGLAQRSTSEVACILPLTVAEGDWSVAELIPHSKRRPWLEGRRKVVGSLPSVVCRSLKPSRRLWISKLRVIISPVWAQTLHSVVKTWTVELTAFYLPNTIDYLFGPKR